MQAPKYLWTCSNPREIHGNMKYVVNRQKQKGDWENMVKTQKWIPNSERGRKRKEKKEKGNHILNVRVNSFHTSTTNTV